MQLILWLPPTLDRNAGNTPLDSSRLRRDPPERSIHRRNESIDWNEMVDLLAGQLARRRGLNDRRVTSSEGPPGSRANAVFADTGNDCSDEEGERKKCDGGCVEVAVAVPDELIVQ